MEAWYLRSIHHLERLVDLAGVFGPEGLSAEAGPGDPGVPEDLGAEFAQLFPVLQLQRCEHFAVQGDVFAPAGQGSGAVAGLCQQQPDAPVLGQIGGSQLAALDVLQIFLHQLLAAALDLFVPADALPIPVLHQIPGQAQLQNQSDHRRIVQEACEGDDVQDQIDGAEGVKEGKEDSEKSAPGQIFIDTPQTVGHQLGHGDEVLHKIADDRRRADPLQPEGHFFQKPFHKNPPYP